MYVFDNIQNDIVNYKMDKHRKKLQVQNSVRLPFESTLPYQFGIFGCL